MDDQDVDTSDVPELDKDFFRQKKGKDLFSKIESPNPVAFRATRDYRQARSSATRHRFPSFM